MANIKSEPHSLKRIKRVVVLIAVHNRKELTLQAVESLFRLKPSNWKLKIYVADDGSTDGTKEALEGLGLDIKVLSGTGNWYWAQSMYQLEKSIDEQVDGFLWMNDDVVLFQDSLSKTDFYQDDFPDSILVGQLCDAMHTKVTYGGLISKSIHPQKFELIHAKDCGRFVDSFNGNFVYVPKVLSQVIGSIDGKFQHAYADIDYGLRARNLSISILTMDGFVGECETNVPAYSFGIKSKIYNLLQVKNLPIKSQIRFLRRHGGVLWPIFLVYSYVRSLIRMN